MPEGITNRQVKTVTTYLDDQWNNPGLNEYYLMQICQKICQILSQKPASITIDQFKLPFAKASKAPQATVAEKRAQARQRFLDRKAALQH